MFSTDHYCIGSRPLDVFSYVNESHHLDIVPIIQRFDKVKSYLAFFWCDGHYVLHQERENLLPQDAWNPTQPWEEETLASNLDR